MAKNKKKNAGSELGTTGLNIYAGKIKEEFLTELVGESGSKLFKQMSDNDPSIGALLFAIEQMIRPLDWKILPSDSKSTSSRKNAEFLDECIHDMADTWEDTISEILSFLVYGFSVHEIVYKIRDGKSSSVLASQSKFSDRKIGWKRLPIRSQQSILRGKWLYAENNIDIIGVEQMAPPRFDTATIPADKYLHFKTTNYKGNPEGKSILRNAYRPWYFKRNIENTEAIGIERDLAGLPVILAPAEIMASDAEPAEKLMFESLKEIAINVRADEQAGIVMPSTRDETGHLLYELSLLSSNGAKQFDTNKVIERYRNEILSTVIADFITLGQGVAGTQALAQTKVDLFLNAIQSWVGQIESVFNRFAVPRLFGINNIESELPTIQAEKIKKTDVDQFVKNILILSQAGMDLFPSESLDEYIRTKLRLPEKSAKDDDWFEESHELELEGMNPTDNTETKPHTNDTTGQTGAENPDADT